MGRTIVVNGRMSKRGQDHIEDLTLTDNRVIRILAGGHMVNLAGPRPMGNSIESMDLGFALQARCLEAVALGRVGSLCDRRDLAPRLERRAPFRPRPSPAKVPPLLRRRSLRFSRPAAAR